MVFTVGQQRFALPLTSIVEVAREANVTPLPKTEPWLKGILILRGNIVSVTDFAKLFDLPAGNSAHKKVVVLRSQKLESTTALLVDRILGIRNINSESIQPAAATQRHELAAGVATVEDSPVTLVDPDQLLGGPRLSTYMN